MVQTLDVAALPVGKQLQLERIAAGRRQIEVARRAGIPRQTLSYVENGWTQPTPELVERIRTAIAS